MSGWSTLFWLIVSFALLYPLNRWITIHIQGVAFLLTRSRQSATWLFWVLFLPGTLLHEASHWITATLLGVKATRFSVWPKMKRSGKLQMGAVQVESSDPFRHSLIGLAPLIFGSVAVLIMGSWLELDRIAVAVNTGDVAVMWQAVMRILSFPDVWLWLYLIFAISNAMLPSESDRESWWSVVLYLSVVLMLVIFFDVNPAVSPTLQSFALDTLNSLFSAFVITLAVDVFFIVFIGLFELILNLLLGRSVQYHS